MTEQQLLERFWARAVSGDRLELLRHYATLAIDRPAEWDYAAVREVAVLSQPRECFCCLNLDRVMVWHHIIQVQHGGSSSQINLVGICELCHARIHPWLPMVDTVRSNWYTFAGRSSDPPRKRALAQQVTRKDANS